MSYVKTEWATGDVITAQKLNNMEDGIEAIDEYADIFTADVSESVENWLDDHPEATTTVEDNAITTPKLQDGAVTTPKLANGSVTDDKLASDGIKSEVADLKTDLSHAEVQFPPLNGVILPPPFEIGTRYVNNGQEAYNTITQRMSIKRGNYVQLKKGDIVTIDRNVLRYFGGGYSTDGGSTFIGISTQDTPYIAPADGIYFFWLYKIGEAVFTEEDVAKGWTYISFKRPDSLVEQLDPILINALKAPNLPYHEEAWIRYSNGEKVASNATRLYVFRSNLPKYIKAFLTSETNALCAIAFYTTDGVSTDGYMQNKSVDFESGTHNDGLWYATEVPSGCKTIAITTKVPSESVADPIILFDGLSVTEANLNEKDYADYPLNKDYYDGWIRHGTGELVASNATKCYPIINNGITKVRVFTKSDTNILDCVSFYSGNTISTDTYLQTSVSWKGVIPNGDWYDVDVPSGVGLIVITVSNASGTYSPKILIPINDLIKLTDNRYALLSQVEKALDERNDDILNGDWRYIYHFGMGAVADRSVMPTIPSQSVFDIRNAHNLGYKCIEANVHKTSDNKYVVTHGQNGALGHDFDTLGGEDAYGVVISENTLQTLKDNYRYRSSIEEYRTSITTLEEFCHEAKRLNMIVMFQYKDPTELAIIKGIMGKRFFMYVAPRSEYKGVISEYYSYTTKAEILARCNTVGKPYIYSMGNPTSFSDSDLQDIINTLHENGYYLASAYVGRETIKKLTSMGFDFIVITDGADVTNEVILDGKKLSFNIDGTVTWEEAPLD